MKITRLAIPGKIDKVVLIDVDAMLTRRPDTTVLLTALCVQETRITGPPQACSRLPALSNSSTDGAGIQQS